MKKMLLGFMILGSTVFANWQNIELVDEFKEPVGIITTASRFKSGEGFIRFGSESYFLIDYFNRALNPVGNLASNNDFRNLRFKFKVDSNEPIEIKAVMINRGGSASEFMALDVNKDKIPVLVEQMKKGYILKFATTDTNGNKYYEEIDLKGFTTTLKNTKGSWI